MAGIGQGEAARMPQHVRMRFEGEAGRLAGTLDQLGEAGSRERRAALAREHERRWRTLALQLAQRAHFVATQRVRGGRALLDPPDVEHGRCEVDLGPFQGHQLRRAEPVPEGQEDHGGVPVRLWLGLAASIPLALRQH
jgi:hypothetical protein